MRHLCSIRLAGRGAAIWSAAALATAAGFAIHVDVYVPSIAMAILCAQGAVLVIALVCLPVASPDAGARRRTGDLADRLDPRQKARSKSFSP